MIAEDAHELADVGEARQVFQRQRLVGQQRGDHQRQRGVLGAGNRDRAVQLGAAANLNAIHSLISFDRRCPARVSCPGSSVAARLRRRRAAGARLRAAACRPRCCALRRFNFPAAPPRAARAAADRVPRACSEAIAPRRARSAR